MTDELAFDRRRFFQYSAAALGVGFSGLSELVDGTADQSARRMVVLTDGVGHRETDQPSE